MRDALQADDPQQAADRLVDLALRAGGPDNVTCIVADIVEEPDADESPIVGGAAANDTASPPPEDSPAARAAKIHTRTGRRRHQDDHQPAEQSGVGDGDRGDRSTSRRLVWLLAAVIVVVGLGVLGSWLYIRTQFYVGAATGSPATVGVYRGVSGDVLGVDLSRLDDRSDVPLTALPDFERSRVESGIDARSRRDADRIVAQLRTEACAQVTPSPSPSPSPAAKRSPKPAASSTPVPTYCKSAP
jgi:protein phosphatase